MLFVIIQRDSGCIIVSATMFTVRPYEFFGKFAQVYRTFQSLLLGVPSANELTSVRKAATVLRTHLELCRRTPPGATADTDGVSLLPPGHSLSGVP